MTEANSCGTRKAGKPEKANAVNQASPRWASSASVQVYSAASWSTTFCDFNAGGKTSHAAVVDFTRDLYKQSHGEFGIMTGFHPEGPVAFAWITYPLRANTNYGLLLVNGRPPIINVEDLKPLDRKAMEQSTQFQNLKNQFPKVELFPGDRDGKIWPNSQAGPNGGIQFVVGYPLLNGCHACENVSFAIFTWNLDAQGKFLGTTFVGMTPPPLQ